MPTPCHAPPSRAAFGGLIGLFAVLLLAACDPALQDRVVGAWQLELPGGRMQEATITFRENGTFRAEEFRGAGGAARWRDHRIMTGRWQVTGRDRIALDVETPSARAGRLPVEVRFAAGKMVLTYGGSTLTYVPTE